MHHNQGTIYVLLRHRCIVRNNRNDGKHFRLYWRHLHNSWDKCDIRCKHGHIPHKMRIHRIPKRNMYCIHNTDVLLLRLPH